MYLPGPWSDPRLLSTSLLLLLTLAASPAVTVMSTLSSHSSLTFLDLHTCMFHPCSACLDPATWSSPCSAQPSPSAYPVQLSQLFYVPRFLSSTGTSVPQLLCFCFFPASSSLAFLCSSCFTDPLLLCPQQP